MNSSLLRSRLQRLSLNAMIFLSVTFAVLLTSLSYAAISSEYFKAAVLSQQYELQRSSLAEVLVSVAVLVLCLCVSLAVSSVLMGPVAKTLSRLLALESKHHRKHGELKNIAFRNLSNGKKKCEAAQLRRLFETCSKMNPSRPFRLMRLVIDGYEGMCLEMNAWQLALVRRRASAQAMSALSETYLVEPVDSGADEICLLLQRLSDTREEDSVVSAAKIVQASVQRTLGTSVSLAISGYAKGIAQTPALYQECKVAAQRRFVTGARSTVGADPRLKPEDDTYGYPVEYELKLEHALLASNTRETRRYFQVIMAEALRHSVLVVKQTIVRLAYCVNRCAEIVRTNGWLLTEYSFSKFLQSLNEAQSIETVFSVFEDYFRIFERDRKELKKTQHEDLVDCVRKIVQREYMDPLLYRVSIADKIGVSPEYLSRLFKHNTGKSLTDYVSKVRMEHAEELLRSSDKSIDVILHESGFSSPTWFFKVFKRNHGVTPSEFRLRSLNRVAVRCT